MDPSKRELQNAGQQAPERLVIGICAHVDAGKTTLSEEILFETGVIRKKGRVDGKDAFLDTDEMEKERGITIYAKQAVFPSLSFGEMRQYTLLDTPGHADFRAETERTMAALDAAVLLISAPEGVNASVRLLWSLLAFYKVPVIIFVNKMDQIDDPAGEDAFRRKLLSEIRKALSPNAAVFSDGTEPGDAAAETAPVGTAGGVTAPDMAGLTLPEETQELLALASEDEKLLISVLDGGTVPEETVRDLVRERRAFPVCFGSALRGYGVRALLMTVDRTLSVPAYPSHPFAARVIKITHDPAGLRETWMKVTGGHLRVREALSYYPAVSAGEAEEDAETAGNAGTAGSSSGSGSGTAAAADAFSMGNAEQEGTVRQMTEKASRIRIWSGERFRDVPEAVPGMVVSVTGLSKTYAGQGLGRENAAPTGLVRPVLRWEILLPANTDPWDTYRKIRVLEEEEPLLSLSYDARKKALFAVLAGQVQREILAETIRKRFGIPVRYGRPDVIYKETVRTRAEGVGHFEPLRHYAEVHLLLEPGEEGSGLVFENACPTDDLPRQYQHQVMEALRGRRHRGVLTGAEITDMKITLIAGKAHEKHTEGGDFRQAAHRAVRQGLMMAENVLLEPWYDFELILPREKTGRAMTDLSRMGASFGPPESTEEGGDLVLLRGSAPVKEIDAYEEELSAYTGGEGSLGLTVGAYRPCHEAESVIEEKAYDPEADLRQPSSSVFCMHGAGTVIPWYMVRDYMHITTDVMEEDRTERSRESLPGGMPVRKDPRSFREREQAAMAAEAELTAIFEKTYGPVKRVLPAEERKKNAGRKVISAPVSRPGKAKARPSEQYLLVDGYNIIFAWADLKELAAIDLKAARDRLMDHLSDYAGAVSEKVILVFDAYRVPGGTERIFPYHGIQVVFTKEAETADQYIEKAAHALTRQYAVRVATSDAVEQMIIFGAGAERLSAGDLLFELMTAQKAARDAAALGRRGGENALTEQLGDRIRAAFSDHAGGDGRSGGGSGENRAE